MSGVYDVRYRILTERLTQMVSDAEDETNEPWLRLALLCLALLTRHGVDSRGRCHYCRVSRRWWLPRSRRCTVLPVIGFYLEQPRQFLSS